MVDAAAVPAVAARPRRVLPAMQPARIILFAVLLTFTLIWISPVVVVLFGALKSADEFFQVNGIIAPPLHPDFSNFVSAWTDGNLGHYMLNSLIITTIKVPLGVFVTSLGAFALSRLRWRFATPVLVLLLMGMVMPVQAALIPLESLLARWGLLNNYASLIAIYIGFGVPFGTLILRGFLVTIPAALDEAAMIDGAGAWQRFVHVIMPLAWPAIASLMIFDSLFTWNEFIFAQLLITDDSMRPAQAGLLAFSGAYQQQFGALNAGILITIAPAVIVYLIFQKRFVAGLAGAVRG